MFKKIADKAKALTDKADLEHAMATTKQIASDSLESGKSKTNEFMEQNWPKIETVLINGLLTVAEERLNDDSTIEGLLDKAYEVLPLAVRLVLPRAKFIELSMKKRDPLLLKLQEYKKQEGEHVDTV